jgi:ABC-type sugar transport system ATPase subunit
VNRGAINIGGKVVNDLPPAQREIAMVFQSYALYPHMDVEKNMGFGLRFAKTPKAEIKARVNEAARILQLEPLLKRRPRELSGGQRQRVAIGRAIVRKPQVFLFDEPLSNLDAALRVNTRVEIAKLHKLLKATIIYVTHDQVEAMTLADKIVVMNQGRIEQMGKPLDLYYKPANLFVAGFIGSPAMNLIPLTVQSKTSAATRSGAEIKLPLPASVKKGDLITLGVRPEHLSVTKGKGLLSAKLDVVERLGELGYAHMDFEDGNRPLPAACWEPTLIPSRFISLVQTAPASPDHFSAIKTAPAATSPMPIQLGRLGRSPRMTTAKIATSTTDSLSIGATCAALPIFSARK